MRAARVGKAVIEFGNCPTPQCLTKTQEASRTLINLRRQNRFTLFTHLCALGDVPKAIEINIGTADDGDRRVDTRHLGQIALHSCNGQRASGLRNTACVLKNIFNGSTNFVGIDHYHVVDVVPGNH